VEKPIHPASKAKSIKRSYTLTQPDLDILEKIKDEALNRKVVLTDSQVIRMGLIALSSFSQAELEKLVEKAPKLLKRLKT